MINFTNSMKRSFLGSLLVLLASITLWGQPLNKATYSTMVAIAEEKLAMYDYYNALDWYLKAYEERQDDETSIIIARLQYLLRDYSRAEKAYGRVLRRDKKARYSEDRFEYARSLKMNENFDEAIEQFNLYLETATDEVKRELAKAEIAGAEFAKIAPEIEGATISNAGRNVNSSTSEYSAFLAPGGNEMYYSGFQTDEIIVIDEKGDMDAYFAKILKSTKTDKGWSTPTPLDQTINRPGFHNTNVSLSPDGNRMYFNRLQLTGNLVTEAKIYMSERSGSGWGPPKQLLGVNGDYVARHPAVGELFGNEVLFFSSNMEGGYGSYDIYYATYKGDGVYGDPVNLGPKLNTVGDEITPFYRDGTLYFSSTGHPGLGGFDIFNTVWDGTRWSEPANMGKGFNTSLDDLYFMIDNEGYSGFLLSNRPGGRSVKSKTCCDDIYNVSLKIITADLVAGVYDAETKKALTGASVTLVDLTDQQPGKPLASETKQNAKGHSFEFPLELDRSYMLIATREDYFPDTLTFNTVGLLDSKTFEELFRLKPMPVFITITREEPIVLGKIYYDFDDDKILPASEPDLELVFELLNEYPDMVIELRSHTDNRGNDNYNQQLSQRRAESARRWLLAKGGVERRRIEAKGYGESVPYKVNATQAKQYPYLKEGQELTEAFINSLETEEQREVAHQINRRTEFQIISGPTSIKIEETRLIRRGATEVEGEVKEEKKK
jgi:peptidoglycan-associated lipoprotein